MYLAWASKEMGLGVRLGMGLGVELQIRDSQYGLGLETGLESCSLVLAGQAVLLCHDKLHCWSQQ